MFPGATLTPRRARHPLHTAFRTVDAADYCEIATIDADRRAVLDLCAPSLRPSHMTSRSLSNNSLKHLQILWRGNSGMDYLHVSDKAVTTWSGKSRT